MAFFQVDDKFASNHKVRAMIEGEGFAKASAGVALWTLSGSLARLSGFDGVITLGNATSVTLDRSAARRAAEMLVRYGLWHAPGHECEACPQPPDGAWVFHQWFQFNYGTGTAERAKTAKGKELRTPEVVEAVWARDTDGAGQAHCRYCGRKVRRPSKAHGGDRRSAAVGQLDHVDPTKAIGASNIVVACPPCNQQKAQRTPEAAGMTLRPPPQIKTADQDEIKPPINPGSTTEVSPPRARSRAGAGGVRAGVVVGSGRVSQRDAGAGQAGLAADAPVGARWGSPWKDHHGRPPTDELIHAATCSEHGLPMPCSRCFAQESA